MSNPKQPAVKRIQRKRTNGGEMPENLDSSIAYPDWPRKRYVMRGGNLEEHPNGAYVCIGAAMHEIRKLRIELAETQRDLARVREAAQRYQRYLEFMHVCAMPKSSGLDALTMSHETAKFKEALNVAGSRRLSR